jgi:hypothetical protein
MLVPPTAVEDAVIAAETTASMGRADEEIFRMWNSSTSLSESA